MLYTGNCFNIPSRSAVITHTLNVVTINKWSVNSLPDEYMLTDRLEKLPLAQINTKTFSHKVILVFAWFIFPLLFFSMVDAVWEQYHKRKRIKLNENQTK